MTSKARNELESIKAELNSIIKELEDISGHIRHDFVGIGNDKCANCIDKILSNYYTVKRKLNNMDTNTIMESFLNSNGGGGHSF